jgi:hypothetical protein
VDSNLSTETTKLTKPSKNGNKNSKPHSLIEKNKDTDSKFSKITSSMHKNSTPNKMDL